MTGVVIARAPLRISLGGGGTDLPSFYRKDGGEWVAAAIDKYVYVAVHPAFDGKWRIRYSRDESVSDINGIEHPIIREALREMWRGDPLEIVSVADVPAGTGLGSSGAFTVALVHALYTLASGERQMDARALAEMAFEVEHKYAGIPVGKQDPWASALGWCRQYHVGKTGFVTTAALRRPCGLMLFFTGATRMAETILREHASRHREIRDEMREVRDLGIEMAYAIERGDMRRYGMLMEKHWQGKRVRVPGMTSHRVDLLHDAVMEEGASGAKLVGAGGGGFLLVQADSECQPAIREKMRGLNAKELPFDIVHEGARTL